MFIAALLTVVKIRKQPKYLSADIKWVKKPPTHTHTGTLFSPKIEGNPAIYNMDKP